MTMYISTLCTQEGYTIWIFYTPATIWDFELWENGESKTTVVKIKEYRNDRSLEN